MSTSYQCVTTIITGSGYTVVCLCLVSSRRTFRRGRTTTPASSLGTPSQHTPHNSNQPTPSIDPHSMSWRVSDLLQSPLFDWGTWLPFSSFVFCVVKLWGRCTVETMRKWSFLQFSTTSSQNKPLLLSLVQIERLLLISYFLFINTKSNEKLVR